jgi:hypothetical protein
MSFSNPYEISHCPITHEYFKNGDFVTCLPCKHFYDPSAMANWISNSNSTCPLCRIEFTENDIIYNVFYKKPEAPVASAPLASSAPSAPLASAPLDSAPSAPPTAPVSKYVICSKCSKSKYRNNFKGLDKNFKCGGCRKNNVNNIDNEIAIVMAYSLIHY